MTQYRSLLLASPVCNILTSSNLELILIILLLFFSRRHVKVDNIDKNAIFIYQPESTFYVLSVISFESASVIGA